MNRTKKLMTTVTTSLLLTGTLPGPAVFSSAFGQTVTKPDETWMTDPEVGKAADQIFAWLENMTPPDAKSADAIRKQFPALSASMVDKALMRLDYEKRGGRLGDGTKEKPYLYYGHDVPGHGGG
jgi:hypothetical protein